MKATVPKVVADIIKDLSKPQSDHEIEVSKLMMDLKSRGLEVAKYFSTEARKASYSLDGFRSTSIVSEQWVRAVSLDYNLTPLSHEGSLKSNNRFNSIGQPTIYLAEDDSTVTKEVRFSEHFKATTLFGVDVSLQVILDLSDTSKLSGLKIKKKLIRGPWKSFNNIKIKYYTQFLSDYLRTLPIEGFIYESVQEPGKKCLCIFPEKMIKGSKLSITGTYKSIEDDDMTFEGDA